MQWHHKGSALGEAAGHVERPYRSPDAGQSLSLCPHPQSLQPVPFSPSAQPQEEEEVGTGHNPLNLHPYPGTPPLPSRGALGSFRNYKVGTLLSIRAAGS